MKINSGFILRKVGTDHVVVAVGEASKSFHGMIKLNDSAAYIWKQIEAGLEPDEIVADLTTNYTVDAVTAKQYVDDLVGMMKQNGILQ